MIKIHDLEAKLQELSTFERPKILLEQYATTPHIASRMLHVAQTQYNDIADQKVADLGAGCGILSIGALTLGASYVVGFDIDKNALQLFAKNCHMIKEPAEAICCDILSYLPGRFEKQFQTVIMNPPFGTKHNAGIDSKFLEIASKLSCKAIYSLHKTSTRNYILRKAEYLGLKSEVIAELKYNLSCTYKFHKKNNVNVAVDFIRFSTKD